MLTDNEIIKAINLCAKLEDVEDCEKCPAYEVCFSDTYSLIVRVADLINRQKAEIEELKSKNSNLTSDLTSLTSDLTSARAEIERYEKIVGKLAINKDGIAIGTLNGKQTEYIQKSVAEVFRNMAVNRAKAEAVKEFAERLKKDKIKPEFPWDDFTVTEGMIDNLVKEFTEGEADD